MSQEQNKISRRQLLALAYVCLLSPVVRRFPRYLSLVSGRAAVLAPLAAILPLIGIIFFMCYFLRSKGPGRGLEQITLDALGKPVGRIVLLLFALWLTFYNSFILRTSADRFISTVYPHSQPTVFIVVTAILALIAAEGNLKTTARAAMVFRPILLTVFVLLFFFILPDIHMEELLPISRLSIRPAILGAQPIINTVSIVVYLAFLEGDVEGKPTAKPFIFWMLVMAATIFFICFSTIGVLGAELTAKTNNPFFTMIRGITLFNTLERVEAVVIALWVFTDFILTSILLFITTKLFMTALPFLKEKYRGILVLVQGVVLLWIALNLADTSFELLRFSDRLIPKGNGAFIFALLPLIFIVGKIRKKI